MRTRITRLVASTEFHLAVIGAILLNVVVATLEGYPYILREWGPLLHGLDTGILIFFTVEIACRLTAQRPVWGFFRSGWNWFDFLIVAASLAFYGNPSLAIARTFRLLRVLRTLTVFHSLQEVVRGLLGSLPAIGNIMVLLLVHVFFFAVLGTFLFQDLAPEQFGTPHASMLTLAGAITLDGWFELMRDLMNQHSYAWPYFLAFVLSGAFVLLNLGVGVVVSSLDAARREEQSAEEAERLQPLQNDVQALQQETSALRSELRAFLAAERGEQPTAPSNGAAEPPVSPRQQPRLFLTAQQIEEIGVYQATEAGGPPERRPELAVLDLSGGGARVVGPTPLREGSTLELRIPADGQHAELVMEGEVVRTTAAPAPAGDAPRYEMGVALQTSAARSASQWRQALARLVF